ncbi:hypothetical protein PPYR_15466, partial [Photinus pyralis]
IFCCLNSECDSIINVLHTLSDVQTMLAEFKSEYRCFKYFEECDSFIRPEVFSVGEHPVLNNKSTTQHPVLALKKIEIQKIPLRRVLQKFLELPNVYNILQQYLQEEDSKPSSVLSNVFQGSLWQSMKTKFGNRTVFPLYMFFDDFESCNPFGSKAGIHKIGAVYVSLACIPPEYSSILENVFLAQLFYSKDRTTVGNGKIFSKLLEEFKYLEEYGIEVHISSKRYLLGDNLGLNSILGFNESFNANYFCRICKTSKELSKIQSIEDFNTLRTINNYDEDSRNLSFGIKQICIFNDLRFFHVVENISVDLMHDLLEGVLRYDMAHILNNLISKKFVSLPLVNSRIKFFKFSEADIGNPIPIIKIEHLQKNYLTLSASEMLAFVVYFGILLGDRVPDNDEVWEFYLNLHRIIHIITSRTISRNAVELLKTLIDNHNKDYCALFNDSLKPKHHILVHYPTVILKIGPPRLIWGMKYESFHKTLKNFAGAVTTRKNIIATLAVKQQLKLSSRFLSVRGIDDNICLGPCEGLISQLPEFFVIERLLNSHLITFNSNEAVIVNWVKINNIKYKEGLCLQFTENDIPDFIKIKFIFHINNEIYFVGCLIYTIGYNTHIQAYEIRDEIICDSKISPNNFKLIPSRNMLNRKPSNIHYTADVMIVEV